MPRAMIQEVGVDDPDAQLSPDGKPFSYRSISIPCQIIGNLFRHSSAVPFKGTPCPGTSGGLAQPKETPGQGVPVLKPYTLPSIVVLSLRECASFLKRCRQPSASSPGTKKARTLRPAPSGGPRRPSTDADTEARRIGASPRTVVR